MQSWLLISTLDPTRFQLAKKSDIAEVQEESLYRANVGPTLGTYKSVWGIFEIQRQNQR